MNSLRDFFDAIDYIAIILVLCFIVFCVICGIQIIIEMAKYLYHSWKKWRYSSDTNFVFSLIIVWLVCSFAGWIIYPIKTLLRILCVILSCYIIVLQIDRILKQKKKKVQLTAQTSDRKSFSREEIIATPIFQKSLRKLINTHRWMTLADARHPEGYSPPSIFSSKQNPYIIEFKKTWGDLWLENLKQYYNGQTWVEREEGLNKFAVDLFGENAEEMKKIISIEYIADCLIELENPNGYDSDYILHCDVAVDYCHEWNYCEDIRALYIQCLKEALMQQK